MRPAIDSDVAKEATAGQGSTGNRRTRAGSTGAYGLSPQATRPATGSVDGRTHAFPVGAWAAATRTKVTSSAAIAASKAPGLARCPSHSSSVRGALRNSSSSARYGMGIIVPVTQKAAARRLTEVGYARASLAVVEVGHGAATILVAPAGGRPPARSPAEVAGARGTSPATEVAAIEAGQLADEVTVKVGQATPTVEAVLVTLVEA